MILPATFGRKLWQWLQWFKHIQTVPCWGYHWASSKRVSKRRTFTWLTPRIAQSENGSQNRSWMEIAAVSSFFLFFLRPRCCSLISRCLLSDAQSTLHPSKVHELRTDVNETMQAQHGSTASKRLRACIYRCWCGSSTKTAPGSPKLFSRIYQLTIASAFLLLESEQFVGNRCPGESRHVTPICKPDLHVIQTSSISSISSIYMKVTEAEAEAARRKPAEQSNNGRHPEQPPGTTPLFPASFAQDKWTGQN